MRRFLAIVLLALLPLRRSPLVDLLRVVLNTGASNDSKTSNPDLAAARQSGRRAALADAESVAAERQASAGQLRLAAAVHEGWWQWQRTGIDAAGAGNQLDNTRLVAADVARRTKAGDLARADQHHADGAVARAEASLGAARQHLRGQRGAAHAPGEATDGMAEPEPGAALANVKSHAALQELNDRVAVADQTAALTTTQSRAHPELRLATTRDRGANGAAATQTVNLALRIPFGGGPRHGARSAGARAEAAEVQARLALERERLVTEREGARLRVTGTRIQLDASERRARLARELRGFIDKSFRLGETDLPTRLRIEAEAAEAERQAARTRIELALRQASAVFHAVRDLRKPMNFIVWLGANHSDALWHREDLQRRQAEKGAVLCSVSRETLHSWSRPFLSG